MQVYSPSLLWGAGVATDDGRFHAPTLRVIGHFDQDGLRAEFERDDAQKLENRNTHKLSRHLADAALKETCDQFRERSLRRI